MTNAMDVGRFNGELVTEAETFYVGGMHEGDGKSREWTILERVHYNPTMENGVWRESL